MRYPLFAIFSISGSVCVSVQTCVWVGLLRVGVGTWVLKSSKSNSTFSQCFLFLRYVIYCVSVYMVRSASPSTPIVYLTYNPVRMRKRIRTNNKWFYDAILSTQKSRCGKMYVQIEIRQLIVNLQIFLYLVENAQRQISQR